MSTNQRCPTCNSDDKAVKLCGCTLTPWYQWYHKPGPDCIHCNDHWHESAAPAPKGEAGSHVYVVWNSGFPHFCLPTRERAEICAKFEFPTSPEVEIRKMWLSDSPTTVQPIAGATECAAPEQEPTYRCTNCGTEYVRETECGDYRCRNLTPRPIAKLVAGAPAGEAGTPDRDKMKAELLEEIRNDSTISMFGLTLTEVRRRLYFWDAHQAAAGVPVTGERTAEGETQ